MSNSNRGFLHGLKVLDLTDHRGIMAGRMFGLMGADLLQIEPVAGTASRRLAPFDAVGKSLFWASYGTGRTSLVLDRLADPERLMALIGQADIGCCHVNFCGHTGLL